MSSKVSPFAKLTSEEKQIKWIEYQSIRLPYTQVPQSDVPCNEKNVNHDLSPEVNSHSQEHKPVQTACTPSCAQQPDDGKQSNRLQPPPEVFVQPKREVGSTRTVVTSPYKQMQEYQKTRHRQYDAVIDRMKQAERKTGTFHLWSE